MIENQSTGERTHPPRRNDQQATRTHLSFPQEPLSQSFPQQIASARKQKLGVSQWVHQFLRSNPNPLIPQYTTVVPGEPTFVLRRLNRRSKMAYRSRSPSKSGKVVKVRKGPSDQVRELENPVPPSKKKKWRTQVPFRERKFQALPTSPFVRCQSESNVSKSVEKDQDSPITGSTHYPP